ncbi:MAG: type II toxin-antitoxin system VapC family toxin [Caldilineaceae bacterium]|nr:type II toxin-antitoxin system VapC family toxin [Caldilineaceae bacterium]
MPYLLDTHTFLWWIDNDPRLSARVDAIIRDGANELWFSAASSWEIAIKTQLGKLSLPGSATTLEQFVIDQLTANYFVTLPIRVDHTLQVYHLPLHHRDPFDRILIAQSSSENVPILTDDPFIRQYDVQVIW